MSPYLPAPTQPASDTEVELDALTSTKANRDVLGRGTGSSRIRICHVSMTLRTGGLERLLVDFARHANQRRYQLHFVSLTDGGPPAEELRRLDVPVDLMGFPDCGKLGLIRRLSRHFRSHHIHVVHTHNTYAHFYATLAAKLAGVRVVMNTQHGRGCGNGWKDHWQFRIANRFATRIVGVSDDATRLCLAQNAASRGKMLRVWNGIDVDRFEFVGPQPELSAISVARLSPEKDFGTLLRATAIVLQEFPQFRLRIVGDGQERAGLERLSTELGLTSAVEFMGERSNVPALLATAGFFVSSSRTEGISLTVLEAMSVGLPVVTTAVGGNPEIVVEGTTGLLAPAENPQALADAILRMCRVKSSWKEMGRAGRERVEEHFNIRSTMAHYETLYEQALSTKRD
jgi:glycosyltransferase involved in cell wall biosynthesis